MASVPRLGLIKRMSLEGVADGWGADCFMLYRPASIAKLKEFKTLKDNLSDEEGLDYMTQFVKDHLVRGRVMVLDDNGDLVEGDLSAAHVDECDADTLSFMFSEMLGVTLDPKDLEKARSRAIEPSSGTASTGTPSSTT